MRIAECGTDENAETRSVVLSVISYWGRKDDGNEDRRPTNGLKCLFKS
jgi:hypothetical protein